MTRSNKIFSRSLIVMLLAGATFSAATQQSVLGEKVAAPEPVVVPFEYVTRHILIRASINNSEPLWFIFDTGDKVAIVDLEQAKSLGLSLSGEVNAGGAGAGTVKGSVVRGATLKVLGLESNPQPVMLAIPLDGLEPRFGHDIDGIIGADFIKQFVVEVDYAKRVLRFHNKDQFNYSGSGEIVRLTYVHGGYPVVDAGVTVPGREAVNARFVVDIGSGGSLALHRPFVEKENLPGASVKTIRQLLGGGLGGKVSGRVGRITRLTIGKFQIDEPLTLFSEDRTGAFANAEIQGNIGAQILSKFKVFLDYSRDRLILEPNESLKDPIGPYASGVRFVTNGTDYRSFRVEELLEESPATEAGLQPGDVVLTVDGRASSELTLSALNDILEKANPHRLSIRRNGQTLQLTLTPRKLV